MECRRKIGAATRQQPTCSNCGKPRSKDNRSGRLRGPFICGERMSDTYGYHVEGGEVVPNDEKCRKTVLSASANADGTMKSRTEPTDYHADQQSDGGSANDTGPGYYRMYSPQLWDFLLRNDIPYGEASIAKKVIRWRNKNGIKDLYEARILLNKLIELEEAERGV